MSLFRAKSLVVAFICVQLFVSCVAFGQGTQPQTIKLFPISDQTFGVAPFQVIAIASSELPVTTSVSGPATLNGRLLTITGVGKVTISAHQSGNSAYLPADAQETLVVNPGVPAIQWNPGSIIYGTPLDSSILNASATVVPAASPSADTTIVTWQLNTSKITGGNTATVPASSPVFRYEGGPMIVSPYPNDHGGLFPDPAIIKNPLYRVAFTCDCQQFEFMLQTRQGDYRLWVDGSWTTADGITEEDDYPKVGFYRVQFPDKRPRQIKIGASSVVPFYGVVVSSTDTISASQIPIGPRVIIFGDSWSAPTIVAPALPPDQPGIMGSGHGQVLGEYFNWEWLEDGLGSAGFITPGAANTTFDQHAKVDICGGAMDMIVIMGGINDNGSSEAAEEQAVTQFLSDIEACKPNAKIFFIGPQYAMPGVSDGIHAAVAKFSNVTYGDPGAENWFYGSSTDPSTGNAYLYVNSHPTPLGHDYWAEKEAQFILNNFPSMAPQALPLFDPAPAAGTFNYSVGQQTILPAGQQKVSVTFTPQDNTNYASVTQQATLTVEKAQSSISLSTSASNTAPGNTVTLTATVSPQIGGVPTGSVIFLDNGNVIGTNSLNQSGIAFLPISSLASGAHAVTASYSGDGNFFGSGTSQSLSVLIAKPDFSFNVDSTQLTVLPTQSATTTVTVTPISGLNANLNLSCSGLPTNATCSLAHGTQIALNNQTTKATVIVAAYASKTTASNEIRKLRGIEICGLLGIAFVFGRKNRRGIFGLKMLMILLFSGLAIISGCGSNSKINTAEPGTYTVQLNLSNAADASMTHSQTITVVIP